MKITAEVGTTGCFETIELTDDPRPTVGEVVSLEHPCTDEDCDIAQALDADYPFWAAELLLGSTETPLLDAVVAHYKRAGFDFTAEAGEEREAWIKERES